MDEILQLHDALKREAPMYFPISYFTTSLIPIPKNTLRILFSYHARPVPGASDLEVAIFYDRVIYGDRFGNYFCS